MVDVSISVPTDFITAIFQSFLGESYIDAISIGFQALLIGYIFLSYRFVIRGKNNSKWLKIKQIDKLVISFFLGFGLFLIGATSMFTVVLFFARLNLIESLIKVNITPNHILYGSIFAYSFFLIYDPKILSKKKYDIFYQIEKYFEYLAKLFFILIAFMCLSLLNIDGIVGFICFILFYYLMFHFIPKVKKGK